MSSARRTRGPRACRKPAVEDVLKSKVNEVETCWQKLPADQRKTDVAAVLSIR